mgnify:CR=1 FL=1
MGGGISMTSEEQKWTTKLLDKLIANLEGSCDSMEDSIPEETKLTEDDMTIKDLEYIDEHVYLCSDCGWWYENSGDQDEDNTCPDCQES